MQQRSVQHETFTIERSYSASPSRVFAAWASPEAKAAWFSRPREFDFRVGGREYSRTPHNGAVYTYDACYQEIVSEQRIVYTYTLDCDETRISVSVATVQFQLEGSGTKLIFTEQGAFLDGGDQPEYREQGTKSFLDALDVALRS
jgi:uncharacterized protein YndB with AHSA1/START domain